MNPYLEQTCHWFGAVNCESASVLQCTAMALTAAAAAVVAVWSVSKLAVAVSD